MVVQHKSYPICPPWLKPLISSKFFDPCNNHTSNSSPSSASEPSCGTRIECNLFCLDCMDKPLCFGCTFGHKNHHVVQIRRSSYHDVIRVSEIQKVLDLSGIQSYIINSARVVFLNGRPQTKLAKGVTKTCEICERSLNENFRYCSLGCKLQGISKHSELTFMVQPKPQVGNGHHRVYAEDSVSHKKSRTRKAPKLDNLQSQQRQRHQQPQDELEETTRIVNVAAPALEEESPQSPSPQRDAYGGGDVEQQQVPMNGDDVKPKPKAKEEDDNKEEGVVAQGEEDGRVDSRKSKRYPGGGGVGKREESSSSSQQQFGPVEICPSTPPQEVTWTDEMCPGRQRAAKRRKGTPHRSHLG